MRSRDSRLGRLGQNERLSDSGSAKMSNSMTRLNERLCDSANPAGNSPSGATPQAIRAPNGPPEFGLDARVPLRAQREEQLC